MIKILYRINESASTSVKSIQTVGTSGSLFEDTTGPVLTIYGIVYKDIVLEIVSQAREYIKSLAPSLNRMLGSCDIIYTGNVGTMATDGSSIMINPGFVMELDRMSNGNGPMAVAYVLLHETLHILFDHTKQYNEKSSKYPSHTRANCAMDCEVNWFIENYVKEGINEYPFNGWHEILDAWWNQEAGEKGWLWERIYKEINLPEKKTQKKVMSSDWKRGFEAGYKHICNELRAKNLIY